MGDHKYKKLHYIIEVGIVTIAAILQVIAVYFVISGQMTRSVALFIMSYVLMLVLAIQSNVIRCYIGRKYEESAKVNITFSRIANSLASDYDSVYYLDMDDHSYVEYAMKDAGADSLAVLSSGDDFFADTRKNTELLVFENDRKKFTDVINEERLSKAFRNGEIIHLDYRLVLNGEVVYYNLKVTQGVGDDDRYIIIGVKNVDAETRARLSDKDKISRGIVFNKVADALATNYEVLYYIDLTTDEYEEYSSSKEYAQLDLGQHGMDFFQDTKLNMARDIYSEDYPMMAQLMDKNNFINVLNTSKRVTATYRLVINGNPEYMELRAIRVKNDENHVVLGVVNIDESVKREAELKYKLDNVMNMANRDALTGVKNKNAYTITENELNQKISQKEELAFAVVVCDVNNLKRVNDTMGHKVGDEYIRSACMMVCKVFKHSPVYRVGGDEFVAIMRGDDYENRNALLQELRTQVEINKEEGMVVLASGMAEYVAGVSISLADVFEKADKEMYINKKQLKQML